jgi:hypothetical protein
MNMFGLRVRNGLLYCELKLSGLNKQGNQILRQLCTSSTQPNGLYSYSRAKQSFIINMGPITIHIQAIDPLIWWLLGSSKIFHSQLRI